MLFSTVLLSLLLIADTPTISSRQYRSLRARARTSADFAQLAHYAHERAVENRRNGAECEMELRGYESGEVRMPTVPKHPSRLHTLRSLISYYRRDAAHWEALEAQYADQAGHTSRQ